MTTHSIIAIIILIISFSNCTNEKSPSAEISGSEKRSINNIEINLLPAFDNYSRIRIDKSSNTMQFTVDTTVKWYHHGNPPVLSMTLDSLRANTSIDSFCSQSFLDSIKSKPDGNMVRDGLSIFTVIKRGNFLDTINSGNVYPKILSTSIISQLDYISKNTTDKELKKYIKDLREYFH